MRLTPIIALVNDEALAAIDETIAALPPTMRATLDALCADKAWTIDAVIAGHIFNCATTDDDHFDDAIFTHR
jgi:hypothetical protein